MKVLVIGNGGREHAIAWKLAQSPSVSKVVCIPGNGGTAAEDKCVNISPEECPYLDSKSGIDSYVEIAKHENCDFAVIGPEDPLAQGIADKFWEKGIKCVGPKKEGAQLEASKDLAKAFMHKYGVACAGGKTFTDEKEALAYVEEKGAPIVVKADGLAAGKGVVVAKTKEEALQAVHDLMEEGKVGDAGKKLVIEDYLRGVEISILAAVSVTPELAKEGKAAIVPFLAARDHKRLMNKAQGPNTGGMGAICPVDDANDKILEQFNKNILEPTLKGLIAENFDYRGFIFFGIMLTEDGPKALEYNVRLGDPETQAVLPMMDFDFAAMCQAIIDGSLKDFEFKWKKGYTVAPVAVSGGYPASYKKGMEIKIDQAEVEKTGAKVFIAGAVSGKGENEGKLITSGGRVLACSAQGGDFETAWKNAYKAMDAVKFDGMFFRTDIGLPGAAESN